MAEASNALPTALSCRKTVFQWAAGGGLVFLLCVVWAYFTGFPYPAAWAEDLPLFPITYALLALNLPAAIMTIAVSIMEPEISEWFVVPLALIADISIYALVGAYWCMLTRSAQANRRLP
jgi:hypothetical protein